MNAKITTYKEACYLFTIENTDNFNSPETNASFQPKGTDICLDLHCDCGTHSHFDGDFCHKVKCKGCGKVYAINTNIKVVKITSDDDDCTLIDETL